jgi:hypothetical protein
LKKACYESKQKRWAVKEELKVKASPKALIWVGIGAVLTAIGAIATHCIYKKTDESEKEGGVSEVREIYKR